MTWLVAGAPIRPAVPATLNVLKGRVYGSVGSIIFLPFPSMSRSELYSRTVRPFEAEYRRHQQRCHPTRFRASSSYSTKKEEQTALKGHPLSETGLEKIHIELLTVRVERAGRENSGRDIYATNMK